MAALFAGTLWVFFRDCGAEMSRVELMRKLLGFSVQ